MHKILFRQQQFKKIPFHNQFRNKEKYESMIQKAIDYLQGTGKQQTNAIRKVQDEDNMVVDQTNYDIKDVPTFTVQQDIQVFEEQQKYIADLERQRMYNLDKQLGTDTYFHETKPYEERIDTEHIMERSIAKRAAKKENTLMDRFLQFDPQEKRQMPKFRSFQKFTEQVQEIKTYPKHQQEVSSIQTEFKQYQDNYGYLKLDDKQIANIRDEINKSKDGQASLKGFENSEQLSKIQKFIMSENYYTDMSLVKGTQLEDQLLKEYAKKMENQNIYPLYYNNFIYFTKHQNNFESHLNLYRIPADQYKNKEFDFNEYQQQKLKNQELKEDQQQIFQEVPEEECILTKQEIQEFLENYEGDSRIEYLLNNLTINSVSYHNLIFDKDHNKLAIFFDIYDDEKEFVLMIKDLQTNQFFPSIISDVQDTVSFDHFSNFYFVRKSLELERASKLFKSNFNNPEIPPEVIHEEEDPNFEIQIQDSLSQDFMILELKSISGQKINEIYYKECFKVNSPFKLLIDRNKNTYSKVKVGSDSFFFTEIKQNNDNSDFFINGQSQEIFRIKFDPDNKQIEQFQQQSDIIKSPIKANKAEIEKTLKEINQQSNIESFNKIEKQLALRQTKEVILKEDAEIEDFYKCEEGEYIQDFEILQHYGIALIKSANSQQYLKLYNFRNEQFHTLKFEEPIYRISQETVQNFYSQYYLFTLMQPNQPTKILRYNIAMRELQDFHLNIYTGFITENYAQEKIMYNTRDDKEIPAILVYQKENISSESPIVIMYEQNQETLEGKYELQPEHVSLLDRGFVICYPQLRGGLENGNEHFQEGSGIKRLTNFCDLLDLAQFFHDKEISNKIILFGKELGALSCISAYLNNPDLFKGMIIHNGIYDLLDYLQSGTESQKKKMLFGDFRNEEEIQEFVLGYCPYQLFVKNKFLREHIFQNILITSTSDFEFAAHSRKLTAILRENDENEEVFYKEFRDSTTFDIQTEMFCQQFSFLINAAFFKTASRNNMSMKQYKKQLQSQQEQLEKTQKEDIP